LVLRSIITSKSNTLTRYAGKTFTTNSSKWPQGVMFMRYSTTTGLGHSTFDLFVKEAIRLHAPEGVHFEPSRIDDAIRWALPSREISVGDDAVPK
jgi:hypothetical protein